jgi:alpha-L-rhamnosidase
MGADRLSRPRFAVAVLLLHAAALADGFAETTAAARVDRLTCEYRAQPLGIDDPAPRLSWQIASAGRGVKQAAYRVLAASSAALLREDRGDLWDSGEVTSDQSVAVPYAGKPLASGQRCFWKVKVWISASGGLEKRPGVSDWSDAAWWEMGLLGDGAWKAHWISNGKPLPEADAGFYQDDPAPLFRKTFRVARTVRSARLYLSALGYVEASLNGRAVGDEKLSPLWTLPTKRVFYVAHDVTDQLVAGDNCLGVTLGNGWYNPLPLRMWGHVNLRERLPVGRPQFLAQLVIEYDDGDREVVASDDSWAFTDGPVLRNSIYLGEVVDARKAVDGWDRPGLDDRSWARAHIAPAPAGVLQAQPVAPIRVTATVPAARVTEPTPGVYVIDLGRNFAGLARFSFDVPAGTKITMRYGELLNADGSLNPLTSVCGQIKRKEPGPDGSPAIAWQADTYTARGGGRESYTPRFTFHAFRYVELTGLPSRPALEDVVGLRMNAAVEPAGSFACSNDQFNRIQAMCEWTFLSNLFGVQSDCPHRERFGYGGDLVATSDAFLMNFDMAGFYAKAARDWHDSALPDGMLTDTAPSVGIQYCGVGWAMAHPHLLTQLRRYYGDQRLVEEQYPTARRWLELIRSKTPDHIIRGGLHDHEALESEKAPPMVTPLYAESSRMLSRLARSLGRADEADDYARLADAIRDAYQSQFLAADTGVAASGIQGAQAFALGLDMLPASARPPALTHLVRDITDKRAGHFTTGIFGTRYALEALSREGRADLANRVVNQRDFPGWGYMLEQGATTLWEHWQFSDNTFSHNHPMFGSVSQWFYNWLGGIEPAADALAFDRIQLHPQFIDGLDWVRCMHKSVRGPVSCEWRREGGRINVMIEVPANATAQLVLPGSFQISESGRPAREANGVGKVWTEAGLDHLELGSGRYSFVLDGKPAAP